MCALGVSLLLAIVGALVGAGWWLVPFGAVIGVCGAIIWMERADDRVLSAIGAQPLREGEAPRLDNLVDGLCVANGIAHPRLMVLETSARNVCTVGTARHSVIVVTRGLLDDFGRIELEGVVARELALIKGGHTALATALVAVATLWPPASVRFLPPRADLVADVEAVGLTRYPPGLIDALDKIRTDSTVADAPRWTRHLWIEDPCGPVDGRTGSFHSSIDERIATLREL